LQKIISDNQKTAELNAQIQRTLDKDWYQNPQRQTLLEQLASQSPQTPKLENKD